VNEYKITPIYVKSGLTDKFFKVGSLNQLRGYNKAIYLYDDNKPHTFPYNIGIKILDVHKIVEDVRFNKVIFPLRKKFKTVFPHGRRIA